jgi:hypothetical protein
VNECELMDNGNLRFPDGSGACIGIIDPDAPRQPPICWNPWNKVVQDHRTGAIDHARTDAERAARGLPVPWTPVIGDYEVHEAPAW